MAASRELVVKEAELCCYICLEVYDKPRTLPCLHSFCHTCLVKYVEKIWEVDKTFSINCPICRVNTPASKAKKPENWVNNLPVNFTLVSIVGSKYVKMSHAESKCVQCLKDNNDAHATVYCYECSEQLCDKCKEIHKKVTFLSNHKLIDIKNRQGDVTKFELLKSLTKCPEHISEEVRYVCIDHDQLCCNECAIVTHRKCDRMVSVGKELGTAGTSLNISSDRLNCLDRYLDQLKDYELHHQSIIKVCKQELQDKLKIMKNKIDVAFESLERSACAEFDEKSNLILKESKVQNEEIESLKSEIKQSLDKMKTARDLGQPLHLFVTQKVLSNEIAQHEDEIKRLYNKMSKDIVKASENKICTDIEAKISFLISIIKKKSGANVPICPLLKHKSYIHAVKCKLDEQTTEGKVCYAERDEKEEQAFESEETDLPYENLSSYNVEEYNEEHFYDNDDYDDYINDNRNGKLDFRNSFSRHTKRSGKWKNRKT